MWCAVPHRILCRARSSSTLQDEEGEFPCTHDFTHALLSSPFAYRYYSPPRFGPRRLHTSPTSSQATTVLSDPKTKWWSRGRLTKLYPEHPHIPWNSKPPSQASCPLQSPDVSSPTIFPLITVLWVDAPIQVRRPFELHGSHEQSQLQHHLFL